MTRTGVFPAGKPAILGGTPVRTTPFPSWPIVGPEEEKGVLEVLRSGKWWYGERVREFEAKFAQFQGGAFGVTCNNGTVALDLAIRSLGLGAGDEVLVPAYTFIATANAAVLAGCIPIFVDVEASTFNMNLDAAEAAITESTRAIIVVHFGGLPIDMDRVNEIARRYNLKVIEDAAHSWGSQWRGKGISSLGDVGTFSFQMSKNITCGEGGIILTDDEELARIARSYVNVGRIEGREWYEHFIVTGNFRLTEIQAAILLAQLGRLEEQTMLREKNAGVLDAGLSTVPGIHIPPRDERITRRGYHLYTFRYIAAEFGGLPRAKFIQALEAEGIPVSPGYPKTLYQQTAFRDLNKTASRAQRTCGAGAPDYSKVACPVAERFCTDEAAWLTHTILLGTAADMEGIVEAFQKIHRHQHELW